MAIPGFNSTTLDKQTYLPEVESVIYHGNWIYEQKLFKHNGPGQVPAGPNIPFFIDYATTANGGSYTYDQAMAISDDKSSVEAYFTKTPYQETAQTYGVQEAQRAGYGGALEVARNFNQDALNTAAANLRNIINSAAITSLIAQIDNAGNFSDAAISRATYNLDSAETAVGGALTLAGIKLMIAELISPSHMSVPKSSLVLMMNGNVHSDLTDLAPGSSTSSVLTASADGTGAIDMGLAHRIQTFDSIPIMIVPDMPDSDMLCVDRNVIEVNEWRNISIEDKSAGVLADQNLWGIFTGLNIVCKNPKRCGKLSGLT